MKKRIYLDYAATTPIDPRVFGAILPWLKENFGNPSSIHGLGQKALVAIDEARKKVANFLGCQAEEIIFTSSATEANNLAIRGVLKALTLKLKTSKLHLITSQIEHHAVLEPCKKLQKEGVEVTYLPVNKQGLIRISELKRAIKPNTVLVSIMYANNEIGTIQPILEIAKLLKSKSSKLKTKIYFHTDAVQAINYLDCKVNHLGVDLLTLSAHKIYGPKGIGALYLKKGTPILPQILGGGQEQGIRSGTENVAGIVGLGEAINQIKNQKSKIKNLLNLRNKLIDGILRSIPQAKLNGSREDRLPNNANFTIPGAEGEAMVIALDQEGICASTGSACSSRKLEPSHVLLALGLSEEEAHCSLRLTLGRYTQSKEIDQVLKVLPKIVERLRKISGYTKS